MLCPGICGTQLLTPAGMSGFGTAVHVGFGPGVCGTGMTVTPGTGDDDRVDIGEAVSGGAVVALAVAVAGGAVLTTTDVGVAVRAGVAGLVGTAVAGGGARVARAVTITEGVGGTVGDGVTPRVPLACAA